MCVVGPRVTSGDTHRHVIRAGTRYGHANAPRSVTVHAVTCSEAGLLAKLGLLRGAGAEEFLKNEKVRAWCVR